MSDASDREAIAQVARVKEEYTAWLLSLPGVNLVAIGGKETGGRPTGELAVQVYVDAKLPLSEIPPEQRIPEEIDGVKTDVVVGGDMVPVIADGALLPKEVKFDESRIRPLTGGLLISMPGSEEVGTLGCFVSDPVNIDIAYGLTCGHVIFSTDISPPTTGFTKVGQPSGSAGSSGCCEDTIGKYAAGREHRPDRDEALIALSPGMKFLCEIADIGFVTGIHDITPAEAQTQSFAVRKRGGRTGLTGGVVVGLQATGPDVENLLVIRPNTNPAATSGSVVFFAAEGDSGSALVDDAAVGSCQVTGIIRSRDKTNAERLAEGKQPRPLTPAGVELVPAYAMPVTKALKRLKDIESVNTVISTASAPGQVHTVPGGSTVAVPAEVAQRIAAEPAARAAFTGDGDGEGGLRAPVAGAWFAEGRPPEEGLAALRAGLEASDAGRVLIAFWRDHREEVVRLIRRDRRVTIVWHHRGGAALLQLLMHMVSRAELALPETIDGRPLLDCADELAAVLSARGTPALRTDLECVRRVLPDIGGRTLQEIIFALGAVRQEVGGDG
ncbi:hypothetical protein [Streptomyces sp. HUAS TT20]|uniref:hypothetical protein n=1 Tax=Streptomyces sp. HUAS TT20 TaxID=3447509 RepID=UPI0021DA3384|nr:hypothetical protein [Streptomyces sp. HUAS 15-9]UXY32070.1 hypothetical protein N8I87_39650 [Streptomyces sp. HUAS 15-9]